MYTKSIPFKDLNGKPRNQTVNFYLFERDVFKLLVELKFVFDWHERMRDGGDEIQNLDSADVVEFYNNFEEVLLSAYGVPSEDGLSFKRAGRYDFEESVVFNACMVQFVTDPAETMKLVEAILPEGMEDMVKKADESLLKAASESDDVALQSEIARLRAQLEAKTSNEG